jgi:hypothetical protein
MSLVNIALGYAELGWSVIPLVPKCKFPPKGVTWKDRQTKRATPEQIRQWWEEHSEAQIGIVTGKISNLIVIDFDGPGAIERFEARVGSIPETIMQSTGRTDGGTHALFQYHGESNGLRTKAGGLEGVDLKADGGIVVVHPSLHKSGKNYQWLNINPLKHGLDDLLEMPSEMIEFFSSQNGDKLYNRKPLTLQPVKKGERNNTLTRLAGKWIGQGMDLETAYFTAAGWNSGLEKPLDPKEVKSVVESIFNTDRRNHPERHDKEKIKPTFKKSDTSLAFPFQIMTGAAGYFANIYSECIEAPAHFLFMAYLACLGAFISPNVTIHSLLKTQPRLYIVLMGESATERKSTTLTKTVDHFLSVLQDFNVCWGIGSAEGLQRILKKSDALIVDRIGTLLIFDEFKTFISKCQIETSVLLPIVNTLFESNRYETHTKKHDVKIQDAFLSMLAATTRETYERIYSPSFIHIGFTNRVFLVPGTAERKHAIPAVISQEDEESIKENLVQVLRHVGEDGVELDFTPEAKELYQSWYMGMEDSIHAKRLDTYSLRFMELLAVNNLKTVIDVETVRQATALCDWQFDVRKIFDPIDADSKAAVMEEKIRRHLRQGSLSDRDLKRNTNAHKAGLWFYDMALKNLRRANEVGWSKKTKQWFIYEQ